MSDDLVTIEIEIDPLFGASSFGTTEQSAVEAPGGREIVDGEGEMERRHGHGLHLSL
jgi:hypothetical protein